MCYLYYKYFQLQFITEKSCESYHDYDKIMTMIKSIAECDNLINKC